MTQIVMGEMADAHTHLYGRCTYGLFRTVFTGPSAPPHAKMMTSAPKIVAVSSGAAGRHGCRFPRQQRWISDLLTPGASC